MRSERLCLSGVAAALAMLASGCWPIAPIAAITAASSSGGGGGSAVVNSLDGSIILTSATVTGLHDGAGQDQEPNDSMGLARSLGTLDAGRALLRGSTQVGATLHALDSRDPAGARLWRRDFVQQNGDESFRVGDGGFRPTFVAQDAHGVYLLDPQNGWHVQRRATAAGLPQRDWSTPQQGTVTGFAVLWDLLLVLKQSGGTPAQTTLVALEPETGLVHFERSLGATACQGLAAGPERGTGTPRLFTRDAASDTILEFDLMTVGGDTRLGPPHAAFVTGLGARAGALAYDGQFLHVVDEGSGAIHLFDGVHGAYVSSQPPLTEHAPSSIAARLDHGLDAFHVRVPAGVRLPVSLWSAPRAADGGRNRLFVMAVDRRRTLREEPESILFLEVADGMGRTHATLPAHDAARDLDLVIGALEGGSEYQVLVGVEFGSPDLTSHYRTGDAAVAAVLAAAENRPGASTLHAAYADPTLPDFVPGQVVIGADLASASTGVALPGIAGFTLRETRRSTAGYQVLEFQTPSAAPLNTVESMPTSAARTRADSAAVLDVAGRLADQRGVRWCEPLYVLRALTTTPNDPLWNLQRWQHDSMRLRDAWDVTRGSTNVVLGVVDSGIRTENDDLAPILLDGYDFVSNPADSGDGDGVDPDPYDEGGEDSHGTHVAGSAAALGNNGFGVSGVMMQARVIPVRALDVTGSGTSVDIAEGIRYAARLSNVSGTVPGRIADVINLSLGSTLPSNAIQNAVDSAAAAGVLVMAATGNDGMNGILYPAGFASVVAVGASNILDERATYSNYGFNIDFLAPGGDLGDADLDGVPDQILSCLGDPLGARPGLFGFKLGTSMACGNATGVAGLVRGLNPSMGPGPLRTLLQNNARDLFVNGFDSQTGHGTLDAFAAINSASPVLDLNLATADFGLNGTSLVAVARNAGNGQLQVTGFLTTPVMGNVSWLSARVLGDGRTIALSADRTGLADGTYAADLEVQTNGGTQTIQVTLTQTSGALPDVGTVILELRDAGNVLVGSTTTTLGEAYHYQLDGWRRGDYTLSCGVDLDADGVICEPGEPCGAYPSTANAQPISLSVSRLSLDLVLE